MNLVPKLPDRYEILGKLGAGGMGAVYKVHDSTLDKIVALKVLSMGATNDEHLVRFNQEARACARLKHRNIIEILDFGFFDGITPYMVLEFVEGQTLKQRISDRGPLSYNEAENVFAQIARALSHAHSQKIIHRDLKPSNILITETDDGIVIKLFDFGIARVADDADEIRLTTTKAFIGTPTYMSPEQIKNEHVDARSDIYSFGCVMFEALTGEVPFSSPDMLSLIELQLNSEPPLIGDIVPELSERSLELVIDRCLQKNPEERFQSCDELSKNFNVQLPINSTNDEAGMHPVSEKKNWVSIAVITGVLLLLGASVAAFYFNSRETSVPKKKTLTQNQINKRRMEILENAIDLENKKELHLIRIPDYKDSDIKLIPNDGTIDQLDITAPGSTKSEHDFVIAPPNLSETGYEYVSKLTKLSTIKVHGAVNVSSTAIGKLAKLPNLTRFDATNTSFEDVGSLSQLKKLEFAVFSSFSAQNVAVLKDMPLKWLVLQDCLLDQSMLESICRIKTLEIVGLYGSADTNPSLLSQLNSLPKLHSLFLDGSTISNSTIDEISRLRRVTRLSLKTDALTDQDLKKIATMTALEELWLAGNTALTAAGLQQLSKLPSLRSLDVSYCSGLSRQSIEALKKTPNAVRNKLELVHKVGSPYTNKLGIPLYELGDEAPARGEQPK